METLEITIAVVISVGVMQLIVFVALNWVSRASDDVPPHFYRTDIFQSKDVGKCCNCRCGKTVIEGEGSV